MSDRGAILFARYAYPPNALGYCGPAGADAMLSSAVAEIERRARGFEGAWCYLQVLAEVAGLPDPLDETVVSAYWLGSDLLDDVDPHELVSRLTDRFRGQVGGTWRSASGRARAHHSFQVFEVYPWAGLLRPDPEAPDSRTAVEVLDRCRVRVGRVLEVHGEEALVASRPLAWDGARLGHAGRVTEVVRWSNGGRSLIDAPAIDDTVALHWDWLCDVLSAEQADRIEACERDQLARLGMVADRHGLSAC